MASNSPKVLTTGLSPLYVPDEHEHLADIVFVHGIQGHPVKTWAASAAPESASPDTSEGKKQSRGIFSRPKKTPSALNTGERAQADAMGGNMVFWPRDFLPEDCPKTRILTWGYDTNVTRGYKAVNQDNLFAHARNLLTELERSRRFGVPLIFVAHSLGGIIVKEVLRRSDESEDPSFKDIVKSTALVIFLSTPHRGSAGFAGLANVVRRVASFALRMDTNDKILNALVGGLELELGRESFTRLWRQYDFSVKTFQEAQAMSGVNVYLANERVVPPESSSLDDSRERAETINANHITMCKFSSKDERGYLQVSGVLRQFVECLANRIQAEIDELDYACLRSLAFPEMDTRENTIEPAMQDTCSWIYRNQQYCDWVARKDIELHRALLWIKGKPGSGKSTLMKTTFDRLKPSRDNATRITVAHFFHSRGSELQKSPLGLFRTLCHQILQKHQPLRTSMVQIYKKKNETQGENWQWTKQELQVILRSHLLSSSQSRFDLLIDALDECGEEDARDLVKYFADLTSSAWDLGANVNICLSSCPYPNITVDGCRVIIVEDNNKEDIFRYCMMSLSKRRNPKDRSVYHVATEITDKSSGIFLWTVLAVRTVNADQDRGIPLNRSLKNLKQLPKKLDKLFTRLIQDIDSEEANETVRLCSCLLLAQGPLTLLELRQAVAFSGNRYISSFGQFQHEDGNQIADYERFMKRILNLSRGLVEVVVNVSVPIEYKDSNDPAQPEEVGDERLNDHRQEIAQSSPAVVSRVQIDTTVHQETHIQTECNINPFLDIVKNLFRRNDDLRWKRPTKVLVPFHIWDFGHPWGFDLTLEAIKGMKVQFIHDTVRTFFLEKGLRLLAPSFTLAHGHRLLSKACYSYLSVDELRSLPQKDSGVDWFFREVDVSKLSATLSLEPSHLSFIKYAFENFSHHSTQVELARLPLDYFQYEDSTTTVDMICRWDEFPSEAAITHPTVLHFLCCKGFFHSAEALMNSFPKDKPVADSGRLLRCTVSCVDQNRKDDEIAHMVKIILEHGADIGAASEKLEKKTLLHIAAQHNLLSTATCLLERGADPNAEDVFSESPLFSAVNEQTFHDHGNNQRDYSAIYNILISWGADVMHGNSFGDSPLSKAIRHLPLIEVQRFLEAVKPERVSRKTSDRALKLSISQNRLECCRMLLYSDVFCNGLYVESIDDVKEQIMSKQRQHSTANARNATSAPQSNKMKRQQVLRDLAAMLNRRRKEAKRAGRTEKRHFEYFCMAMITSMAVGLLVSRLTTWFDGQFSIKHSLVYVPVGLTVGMFYLLLVPKATLKVLLLSLLVIVILAAYLLMEFLYFLLNLILFRIW